MDFRYSEDKKYFADTLCGGDTKKFELEYNDYFDFRPADEKRREFDVNYKKLFKVVFGKSKGICQICKSTKGTEIDHVIPLKSNLLNKSLRRMAPKIIFGKLRKVPAESYGSNNVKNLQLVCKKCNRKKGWSFENFVGIN